MDQPSSARTLKGNIADISSRSGKERQTLTTKVDEHIDDPEGLMGLRAADFAATSNIRRSLLDAPQDEAISTAQEREKRFESRGWIYNAKRFPQIIRVSIDFPLESC